MKDNIPGFPGYFVSRDGEVYSRYIRGSHKLGDEWRKLKPKLRPSYYNVTLYRNGKNKKIYVHRLVAEAYIPNPDNLPVVMHLDNNPKNNRVENLKWGTQRENVEQAVREHRSYINVSNCDQQYARKLKVSQEKKIRSDWELYVQDKVNPKKYIRKFLLDQAKRYGVSQRTIRKVLEYRKSKSKIYKLPVDQMVNDLSKGMTRGEVSKKWEISKVTLRKLLRKYDKGKN